MTEERELDFSHIPVLLNEVIDALNIKGDGIYLDGTLGGGGHSFEIAKRLDKGGRLIGLDRDDDAIRAAGGKLKDFSDRVTIVRENYGSIKSVSKELSIEAFDGILLDLGVSSHQLDDSGRGFSYSRDDSPLDMRMDRREEKTAEAILNSYPEEDLERIIRLYGEERFSRQIAANIVRERAKERLKTSGQLSDIIRKSIPEKFRRTGGNPSKRTFQALRIEVNDELSVLSDSIDDMIELLKDKGRLCIITFHSLEDRIVKEGFRRNEDPCICPPDFPVCVCGRRSKGKVLTRKAVIPGQEELASNKRAKSSRLRVFERRIMK
ncbi:MAG: 16S rRNA (cytosine(1402)-N(4))-methyltransferase RsmH [Lachnospiraceae bacterium]|nr:16S rRNA (cytosine(1402)-N(4))-methyltransferase RsmH [Lachnospiraceae bacterium]